MKEKVFLLISLGVFLLMVGLVDCCAKDYTGKKILYINSYHKGYFWSDGEQSGAEHILAGSGVELKVIYMDTKNNPSEEFCKQAGIKAKMFIEGFKPDVVICADDNAFKYVIMPYYRDAALPVVFCGINWEISIYGAPYKNTTGMIEIALIGSLYRHLRKFAKGDRIGLLGYDTWNEHKHAEYAANCIEGGFASMEFVKDFDSWKQKFIELQDKVDMLYLTAPDGIKNWNIAEAERFVLENVYIPVGIDASSILAPLGLIGLPKIPEEQGEYAARAALRILDGEKPSNIPVVTNKKGDLYLNLKIADKLGVIFPPLMLRNAKGIIGEGNSP